MEIIEDYNNKGELASGKEPVFARMVKADQNHTFFVLFNSRNELVDPKRDQFLPKGPIGQSTKFRKVTEKCFNSYLYYLTSGQASFFTQANRWRT